MVVELKRELRSYEIRKRRYKQRIRIMVIGIILILLVVAGYYIYQFLHIDYNNIEIIHSIERKDTNSAQYVSYKSGVIRYSRDGAGAIDGAGNLLWNGTYEMQDPIIDVSGDYAVVGDRGRNAIRIFDGNNHMYTVNVLSPIVDVEIANQGVIAVLQSDKETDIIELFDETGMRLVGSRTINKDNGYPVDISLSKDGEKLVTSYISVNSGVVQSKVNFYTFNEVGKNYTDQLVGAFDLGQTIVPRVEFVNADTVCAFGDNKFVIYSVKQTPKLEQEVEIAAEIKSITYNEEYIGLILNNTEGTGKYRVLIYNLRGKILLDKTMNYDYDNVFLSGDEIIFYSDTDWYIWKVDGEEKFNYTFPSNISYVMPVNNLDKYIIIDDLKMNEVKLIEDSDYENAK